MTIFFDNDAQFDFELVRTMGQTSYGGAEIGECLATARRIKEGDYDSWYQEWSNTGQWLFDVSVQAEKDGHLVTARDGYLRSANYFRTAEFFLHDDPSDPRIRIAADQGVDSFERAANLFDPVIEKVAIPYEGTYLPGYFYRAQAEQSAPHPTVIIHNGFDGTAEELFSLGARAGQERGYNILVFDGPGQGQVLRHQGLTFRTDWEAVVSPVIDYLETREEVDNARIALVGISMGGVLAPRAAADEKRLAAVVAWDGVFDMGTVPLDFILGKHFQDREELLARLAAPEDPELDRIIESRIQESGPVRWIVGHGKWVMGASSARALFHRLCQFHLRDGIAQRITCPVLILKAENDMTLQGQPEALAANLKAPYSLHEFSEERGGDVHNQVDVPRFAASVIYDWLDSTLQ